MTRIFLSLLLLNGTLLAEPIGRIEAVERSLNQNLELRAARQTIAAAEAAAAARGLMPNPELDLGGGGNDHDEYELEIGFRQRFPVTNRLRLERRIGVLEIEAAQLEVINAERELAQKTELAWWDLRAAQERQTRLQELQKVLSDQADTTAQAAERGEASALDARRLRLAANGLERELGEARVSATEAATELAQSLSLPGDSNLTASGSFALPGTPEIAGNPLGDEHPAMRAARLGLVRAEAGTALARANRFADIEGGIVARRGRSEDAPEGFENDTFVGLQVAIPLPLWNNGRAEISAAQAVEIQRQTEIEAISAEVRRRVASAREIVAARHQVATEYRSLLSETAETEVQLRDAWTRGEASLLEVIDARRELQRAEVEALDLDLAYQRAAAQLRALALSEEPMRSRALGNFSDAKDAESN